MEKAVVLVIEDQQNEHDLLEKALRGRAIKLVPAYTEEQAQERINQMANGSLRVDAVVINACLGTHDLKVRLGLINEIQVRCPGKTLIGTSMTPAYRDKLWRADCQHLCDHDSLSPMLLEVLGLS